MKSAFLKIRSLSIKHKLHLHLHPINRSYSADSNTNFDEPYLSKNKANYAPLTPISLFHRTIKMYPSLTAYSHGTLHRSWKEVGIRVRQLASALTKHGIKKNDIVSIMAPNSPAIFEAHFAIPGSQAVLHTINTRLDATTIAYQLQHSESKLVFVDSEYSILMNEVQAKLTSAGVKLPFFIDINDPEYVSSTPVTPVGMIDYESFLATGDGGKSLLPCDDEWDAITLNYTSGTTGNPKGVLTHYRGAYLNAISNQVEWNMEKFPRYLWIVPMFHCNGWCFPWTMAAATGTSYFLRQIRAESIFRIIEKYRIGYMSGAPITMITMLSYPEKIKFKHPVKFWAAGAPPPPAIIQKCTEELGMHIQTAYGLTETYGPISNHIPDPYWKELNLSDEEILKRTTYQTHNALIEEMTVIDPDTLIPVPADGTTMGEVMMRGNIVMKGYLKNPTATEECFKGGWFRSGDLGVNHGNGRIELKDRSKDIIISGGENISSIEVENIMLTHPNVLEVAVVAMPDEKWGEVPCAFVKLNDIADKSSLTGEVLMKWCRTKMAGFQSPKRIIFTELPKTSTGKVQKNLLRKLL
eukprot:gene8148-11029_t